MRKIGKQLVLMGLVAAMSIAGAISTFAVALDYSDESAVHETGTTLYVNDDDVSFPSVPVRTVGNENLIFSVDESSIPDGSQYQAGFESLKYGYIEDGQFYTTKSAWGSVQIGGYAWPKSQALFDKEQLQKDKETRVIDGRVYALLMMYSTGDVDEDSGVDLVSSVMWAFKIDTSVSDNTTNTTNTTNIDSSYTQGWKQDGTGWWYQYSNGSYVKDAWFHDSDGKRYHFNADGYMQTGWIQDSENWYYLGTDGAALTNTTTPDGYYVDQFGQWR